MHFLPAQPIISWCVLWVYLSHFTSLLFYIPLLTWGRFFLTVVPWFWGDEHPSFLGAADTVISHLWRINQDFSSCFSPLFFAHFWSSFAKCQNLCSWCCSEPFSASSQLLPVREKVIFYYPRCFSPTSAVPALPWRCDELTDPPAAASLCSPP